MHHLAKVALIGAAAVALAAPLSALGAAEKPFRGADSGTFTIEPISPTVVLSKDVAVGHATRLGAYTLIAQERIDLVTLQISSGGWTLVTKHGTLFGTYAGRAEFTGPSTIAYRVSGPILGGTGRYEGASGSVHFDGAADLAAGTLSDELTGVLLSGDD